MNKKWIVFFTTAFLFLSVFGTVYAQEQIDTIDNHAVSDNVLQGDTETVNISLSMTPRMKVKDSVAVLELYDTAGNKLAEGEGWVGGITDRLDFSFSVPQFEAGKEFILKLKSGLTYLKYYDGTYYPGEDIVLQTYGYRNENGEPCTASDFVLEGCPIFEHAIVLYVKGNMLNLNPEAMLSGDIAVAPVEPVAKALGLNVRYDKVYNSVVCEIDNKQAIFNIGLSYANILGTDIYMPVNCTEVDGVVYAPIRTLAEAFGSSVEAIDFGDHIDVCLGEADAVREFMNKTSVNRWNIFSKTPYLVWIDKSDFRVRVYTGSKNNWIEQKSFPCAIGAPGSPTITGSYEYEYMMSRWNYDTYYVGPCLVFYGNYAMHSTLQSYKGYPYDDRVGVMISHGCVRLRKQDIDWLASYLPLKSRIYITE